MGAWTLKFGNAGLFEFLHWRKPAAKPVAAAAATSPTDARRFNARRAEAMRGFFPKLSAWLAHQSYLYEMREVERYLSQASDIFDLERRIRHIERGGGAFRVG